MKKLMFMAACLLSAINGMAQDKLQIADFEIKAGEEKVIDVELINSENFYAGVQFDLTLPEGVSVGFTMEDDEDDYGNPIQIKVWKAVLSDRKRDHDLTFDLVPGSTVKYRAIIKSNTNKNIKQQSGALVKLTLKGASDLSSGELTGSITGQVLSPASGSDTKPADATFKVTATSGINEIEISNEKPATIYDLKGNTVRKNATSTEGLNAGVYIINGAKVIVK